MDDNDHEDQSRVSLAGRLLRREFLEAVGVSAAAVGAGAGSVAARPGSVAAGPASVGPFTAETVYPRELPTPDIPDDPDIEAPGEGSAEAEEVPRGSPGGGGGSAGPTPKPQSGTTGSGLSVVTDYDGFTTRDVVRGIDLDDDGEVEDDEIFFSIPSDAQLATGSDYHVTVVNSEIGFVDKDAPADGADREGGPFDETDYITHYRLEDFFGPVLSLAPGDEPASQFENVQVFDPRARYDPDAGRFYVACVEFNLPDENDGTEIEDPSDLTGAFLLAVSSTSDPTDPWTVYRIPPQNNDGLVDYPTLGYDGEAVYLTQNFFANPSLSFRGATLTVLDRDALMAGDDVAGWEFSDLRNPDGSLAFTLQPAAMAGETDSFYLANSRFGNGKTLTVWDVDVPADFSEPSIDNGSVRVPPYANAPAAQQPGTNKKIDTLDTRLMNLAWDGEHLWTAHTTAPGYVRWYELDPTDEGGNATSFDPSVAQWGAYQRGNWSTFLPTVESNGESTMMVYNASADSQNAGSVYPRIEVAGRTTGYDAGKLQDDGVVQIGEMGYNYDDTRGDFGPGPEENVLRWGDYNGVAVDPDDESYWVISQYAKDPTPGEAGPSVTELYGTRIANVTID